MTFDINTAAFVVSIFALVLSIYFSNQSRNTENRVRDLLGDIKEMNALTQSSVARMEERLTSTILDIARERILQNQIACNPTEVETLLRKHKESANNLPENLPSTTDTPQT